MALDLNQIKEILQKPSKRQVIQKAVNMQRRLRFHTETNIAVSDINQPTTVFLDWVQKLLPKDKFNIFLHLFKFPLSTPAVVEDVYRELERVFYSRNSSSSYQFTNSELAEDWQLFKKRSLNEPDVWKTQGWKKMRVSPNSILIVDLPREQKTSMPEFALARMQCRQTCMGGGKCKFCYTAVNFSRAIDKAKKDWLKNNA